MINQWKKIKAIFSPHLWLIFHGNRCHSSEIHNSLLFDVRSMHQGLIGSRTTGKASMRRIRAGNMARTITSGCWASQQLLRATGRRTSFRRLRTSASISGMMWKRQARGWSSRWWMWWSKHKGKNGFIIHWDDLSWSLRKTGFVLSSSRAILQKLKNTIFQISHFAYQIS